MKVNVIIIGFKYVKDEIDCMLYDIYRVYKYFNQLYDCYILTDICDFTYTISMYNSILKNQVDDEFTDFIGEIKYYPSWYRRVNDSKSLFDNISSLDISDITIVYYSGHGSSSGLLLPSNENVSYTSFRDILVNRTNVELTIILDCCKGSNMNLSYYLDNRCKYYKSLKSGEIISIPILIITSSDINQKSVANDYTSLFTKYFIEFLHNSKDRSFQSMIEYIESNMLGHEVFNQNVKIYSSVARYPIIPSYLFQAYYLDIDMIGKYLIMIKCE